MEKGQDIKDYIPLIGTDTLVQFSPYEGLWIDGIVIGINLHLESILIKEPDKTSFYSQFWDLYFQLNYNHPKIFKVRFKE